MELVRPSIVMKEPSVSVVSAWLLGLGFGFNEKHLAFSDNQEKAEK